MSDMPLYDLPHLQRRGSNLTYRRRLPAHIAKAAGQREFKKTLGRIDIADLEQRWEQLNREYRDFIASVESGATPGTQSPTAARKQRYATPDWAQRTTIDLSLLRGLATEIYRNRALRPISQPPAGDEALREFIRELEHQVGEYAYPEEISEATTEIHRETTRALESVGLPTGATSAEYQALVSYVARALAAAAQVHLNIVTRNPTGASDPLFSAIDLSSDSVPHNPPVVEPGRRSLGKPSGTLRQLIEDHIENRRLDGASTRRVKELKSYSNLLLKVLDGDRDCRTIDFKSCQDLKQVLSKLPPNTAKGTRTLEPREAAKFAEANGLKPMSLKNANKYYDLLSDALQFGLTVKWVDENAAKGHRFKVKKGRAAKREPYNLTELATLLGTPADTSSKIPVDAQIWVPRIGAYQGMRLNEICQLDLSDIRQEDGIPVFDISPSAPDEDEDKSVKTESSARVVPIHPVLIKAGFLKFVAMRRASGAVKVFDLPKDARGYYSDAFSKWFGRLLERRGLKRRGIVFHSLRHTFRQAARRVPINEETIEALGGWEHGDRTSSDYGNSRDIHVLHAAIQKMNYSRIDEILIAAENEPSAV